MFTAAQLIGVSTGPVAGGILLDALGWRWIFWATIVFSLGYWAYYQIGPGPSEVAVYEAEMREAAARQPVATKPGDGMAKAR